MPIGKKRRNRVGRPREFQVARHPSGQIVRRSTEEREEEAMSIAIEARAKHYGVPPELARDPLIGAALGRLFRAGVIDQDQFEAGQRFAIVKAAYERAIMVKRQRSGGDFDGRGGHDGSEGNNPEYVEWYQRATGDYRDARSALLAADPLALMVVEAVCTEDRDMPTSAGELRVGLNALARLWRIGRWHQFGRRS